MQIDKMEFVKIDEKCKKQRSTTPKKLPNHQLAVELKLAKSVQDLNRILRYVSYNDSDYGPSEIMACVMLERLAMLIKYLPNKTSKDWKVYMSTEKRNIFSVRGHS